MLPRQLHGTAGKARKLAQQLGVPVVAVPDSYFLDADDYDVHRVLRAIDLNTSLSALPPNEVAPADAWFACCATSGALSITEPGPPAGIPPRSRTIASNAAL